MPNTAEIIREAESLPVEERALVVESILRSLNTPDPEIDRKWAAVAKRRLDDLRSGRVKPIPGEEVFAKIRRRFAVRMTAIDRWQRIILACGCLLVAIRCFFPIQQFVFDGPQTADVGRTVFQCVGIIAAAIGLAVLISPGSKRIIVIICSRVHWGAWFIAPLAAVIAVIWHWDKQPNSHVAIHVGIGIMAAVGIIALGYLIGTKLGKNRGGMG